MFGLFMIWWGVGRFIVEWFRPDQPTIGNGPITISMVLALAFAAVGLYIVLGRFDKLPESPSAQRRRRRRVRKPKPQRSTEVE
jgi:prolipoprotein diacylglyceryltransferase